MATEGIESAEFKSFLKEGSGNVADDGSIIMYISNPFQGNYSIQVL